MGGIYRRKRGASRHLLHDLRMRVLPALLLTGAASLAYVANGDDLPTLPRVHSYGGDQSTGTVRRSVGSTTCNIKGNISMTSGERIYHVPGQTYYAETVVNRFKGERWFCSESEARAAGWRKAKV